MKNLTEKAKKILEIRNSRKSHNWEKLDYSDFSKVEKLTNRFISLSTEDLIYIKEDGLEFSYFDSWIEKDQKFLVDKVRMYRHNVPCLRGKTLLNFAHENKNIVAFRQETETGSNYLYLV